MCEQQRYFEVTEEIESVPELFRTWRNKRKNRDSGISDAELVNEFCGDASDYLCSMLDKMKERGKRRTAK
jgi:hypothetical protein